MDQIEEVAPDFVHFKNEQCIQIRFRDGIREGKLILTMAVSVRMNCMRNVEQLWATMRLHGMSIFKANPARIKLLFGRRLYGELIASMEAVQF